MIGAQQPNLILESVAASIARSASVPSGPIEQYPKLSVFSWSLKHSAVDSASAPAAPAQSRARHKQLRFIPPSALLQSASKRVTNRSGYDRV
jgi:hypothetical protein